MDAAPDMLYFSAFQKTREAFCRGLEAYGMAVSGRNYAAAGMTLEAGAEAFRRMSESGFDADAVFCVNDLCALGLRSTGCVPDMISLLRESTTWKYLLFPLFP